MKNIQFTEFRKQASDVMTDVEHGESFVILRHGRPIAELRPFVTNTNESPSWKKPALRMKIPGQSISELILEDR